MEINLRERRALVTGGSGGIGKAIALEFAAAGANLAIGYHSDEESAVEVADRVRELGVDSMAIQADVSNTNEVERLFDKLDSRWQGLDILINNAGVQGRRTPTWEVDPDEWRRIVDVNLFGSFLCVQQALRRMIPQQSGVILNITSVHERIPWAGYAAYAASKAATAMLTQTLAQEVSPHGIRVIALAPGAIKTPINEEVWQDRARREQLLKKIPINRVGEPAEVAQIARVLVSDAASYMTGSTVFVDGGMIAYPDFAHGG